MLATRKTMLWVSPLWRGVNLYCTYGVATSFFAGMLWQHPSSQYGSLAGRQNSCAWADHEPLTSAADHEGNSAGDIGVGFAAQRSQGFGMYRLDM